MSVCEGDLRLGRIKQEADCGAPKRPTLQVSTQNANCCKRNISRCKHSMHASVVLTFAEQMQLDWSELLRADTV